MVYEKFISKEKYKPVFGMTRYTANPSRKVNDWMIPRSEANE